ncbi:TonB-dependent receptor plug domain-containing protein [Flavivirga rizhaonensis]|uniref:TonB-dependent receptor plug domain-containing protein n=1 Tax=Flavivirga rizhaonensis TaxID=2559571 RepID=A0A4S1DSS3_9FLAO|nr:TonB-dependent receptor plug domain-containing protein [Flavivirga rizhaonensis]TGV00959.1 hypothetical protein EM932_17390 [Flavivirga rizhaonensis]
MKKRTQSVFLLFLLFVAGFLFQCAPSQKAVKNSNKTASNEVKPDELDTNTLTIIDMLSKVSGVNISGNDENATIQIRGTNTINGNSEPLFVIDGIVIGNGIRSIYNRVQPNQIQSIRVLKGSEMSFYGVRGGNGVIEIKLKK